MHTSLAPDRAVAEMLLLPGVNGGKLPSTYAAESMSGWVGGG